MVITKSIFLKLKYEFVKFVKPAKFERTRIPPNTRGYRTNTRFLFVSVNPVTSKILHNINITYRIPNKKLKKL